MLSRILSYGRWAVLFVSTVAAAQVSDPSRAIGLQVKPPPSVPATPAVDTAAPLPNLDVKNYAALFVGVNNFDPDVTIRSLHYAVNDAIAQAHLFVLELKLIPPENCRLALSGKPEGAESIKQLTELQNAHVLVMRADRSVLIQAILQIQGVARKPSDMIIVSFSSHGFSSGNDSFVMPADGQRGALNDTALAYSRIEDLLHRSKARKVLVLLDACREQPADDGSKGVDGAMTHAFMHALAASEGKFVLASCGEGQYSYENSAFNHGVFTYFLLSGLRGNAGKDRNGFITLGSVSAYVTSSVEEWATRNRPDAGGAVQTPWYKGDGTAVSIPLAIDPGLHAEADRFAEELKKASNELKSHINDDGAFTADLYKRLEKELRKVQFDDAGKDLLANIQDFIKGTLRERVFVAYIQQVLRDRSAVATPADPSDSGSGPTAPVTPAPLPDSVAALQPRIDAGDPAAMCKLARMYAKGVGVERDPRKATELYTKAADNGSAEAMTELGRRYLQDYLVGIDYAAAFQWFGKGAEANDPMSMFYLGYALETGRGTEKSPENANAWYGKAEPLLRDAAQKGDAEAMYALGMLLVRGSGVSSNPGEGLTWLGKAANAGSINAMLSLGLMYESGSGAVARDDQAAFEQYNRAAALGSASGMYHLAVLYSSGRGTGRSANDAVKWYGAAADLGHPLAAFYAGLTYQRGIGVAVNEDEARGWFNRAIDPLQKAAQRGDSEIAMFALGQCYAEGWGLEKNPAAALNWFIKAANRGYGKAAARIGWMYDNGEGVQKNDTEALSWYQKAAGLGDPDARAWLANQGKQ